MESAAVTSPNTGMKWGALAALLVALLLEALFYPDVATRLHTLFSRRTGWDGTGLAFVQSRFVVPGAVGVALVLLMLASRLARRRHSIARLVLVGWAVNFALLALSVAWYARLADKG